MLAAGPHGQPAAHAVGHRAVQRRITRADGVTSVMRGFTPEELCRLVRQVTGVDPAIQRGLFWRLVATWRRRSGR